MFDPLLIFDCFLESFDKSAVSQLRAFLSKNNLNRKWLISADYCIGDKTRPNDCMCFSITPYDMDFTDLQDMVSSVLRKDIKKIKNITQDTVEFLRNDRFFHIAILLRKDRNCFNNGPNSNPLEVAREVAIITLQQMESAGFNEDQLKKVRQLVQESKANSFNYKLFGDLLLLSLFFPFVSLLIARECKTEGIGWFSDRDKMTEWIDGILWTFATNNVRGLAEHKGIYVGKEVFPIAVPSPDTQQMWFDPLLRFTDYIAGSLAVWDIKNNRLPDKQNSNKFLRMVEDVIADSTNLIICGLDIGDEGMQWRRTVVSGSKAQ